MRGEFIDVGGVRAYYYAAGSRGAGHPVLFLHGFAGSGALWQRVVPLVPGGHRVIVADLAGHGRSEPMHGVPDVDEHVRMVRALLEALNVVEVHVVGHGLGCEIAIGLARRDSDRITSLLLLSAAGIGEAIPGLPRAVWVHALLLRIGFSAIAVRRLSRTLSDGYVNRAAGERRIERNLRRYRERRFAIGLRAQLQALARYRAAPVKLDVRAVVAHGEKDPFISVPDVRARFADSPRVTLTPIPGERHFLPEEAPDRVARLVAGLLVE